MDNLRPRLLQPVLAFGLIASTAVALSLVSAPPAATAASAALTVCQEGCNYITIEEAVGDAADDAIVSVKAGTYELESPLRLPDGVDLVADGAATLTGAAIQPVGHSKNLTSTIAGFTLDGVVIETLSALDRLHVKENTFRDWSGVAISTPSENASREGKWEISGNIFNGGAESDSAISLIDLDRTLISGNTITGVSDSAVIVAHSRFMTVTGNSVSDAASGILIKDSLDVKITGNRLATLVDFGIARDNSADTVGRIGHVAEADWVAAQWPGDTLIRNNRLSDAGVHGISLAGNMFDVDIDGRDPDSTTIEYNTVTGSTHAIRVDATTTAAMGSLVNIWYNDLSDNGTGLVNAGPSTIVAAVNWWGSSDGPDHGSGVSNTGVGAITVTPWATDSTFAVTSSSETLTVCAIECDASTIAEAIHLASAGDTIEVAPGTYELTENVIVDKSVHLVGPQAAVNPVTDSDARGSSEAVVTGEHSIEVAWGISNITIDGFTFDRANIFINGGVKHFRVSNNIFDDSHDTSIREKSRGGDSEWTISHNVFRGLTSTDGLSAAHLHDIDGLTITGNSVANTSYGAFIIVSSHDVEITENTISDTPSHGMNLQNNSGVGLISGNTVTDAGTVVSYGAIRFKDIDGPYSGTTTISDNAISGSTAAVLFESGITELLEVHVHENDLAGNELAIENLGSAAVDAERNWWGTPAPDFDALVVGSVDGDPWYLSAGMLTSSDHGTAPGATGEAVSTPETPVVAVQPDRGSVQVIVEEGTESAGVDYSALKDKSDSIIVPADTQISTSDGTNVLFVADTTVTPSGAWDGIIHAPTVAPTDTVTVPTEDGSTATVSTVITLGSADVNLAFDKAVRVLLPGEAGSLAAFVDASGTFTPITTMCAADTQRAGDAVASDCYIAVGDDLVVWTKHFTTFVAYQLAATPGSGSTGGATLPTTGADPAPLLIAGAGLLLLGVITLGFVGRRRREAMGRRR